MLLLIKVNGIFLSLFMYEEYGPIFSKFGHQEVTFAHNSLVLFDKALENSQPLLGQLRRLATGYRLATAEGWYPQS